MAQVNNPKFNRVGDAFGDSALAANVADAIEFIQTVISDKIDEEYSKAHMPSDNPDHWLAVPNCSELRWSYFSEKLDLAPTIEVGKYSIGDANGFSYNLNSSSPSRINFPPSYGGKDIFFGTTNVALTGLDVSRTDNNLIVTNNGSSIAPIDQLDSFFVDLNQ